MIRVPGRQTQYYFDLVYRAAFVFSDSAPFCSSAWTRIIAFQGGLVLGYFLRVWENMTVYERILEEGLA
ncbi:hypothetical protein OB919_01495 [Halobacteria archaeon AArc-curdl1]|uniref:Uncharacterized protein n=1 Tax=Natronosalvus hydrolyticus TaxID=2979988 RepID=A0AAP2Z795_9EURY|nr:hypothetical protein [Halobacteria archaeon AArc-curdl1]